MEEEYSFMEMLIKLRQILQLVTCALKTSFVPKHFVTLSCFHGNVIECTCPDKDYKTTIPYYLREHCCIWVFLLTGMSLYIWSQKIVILLYIKCKLCRLHLSLISFFSSLMTEGNWRGRGAHHLDCLEISCFLTYGYDYGASKESIAW